MPTRSHESAVLLFAAPHCSSCRAVRPAASEVATAFNASVSFREIDATMQRATASHHGVKGVPTFVAIHDDIEVGRLVGVGSRKDLEKLFEAANSGTPTRRGISSTDRVLRLAVATSFAGAALVTGVTALWLLAGGVGFFGVWDMIRPERGDRR